MVTQVPDSHDDMSTIGGAIPQRRESDRVEEASSSWIIRPSRLHPVRSDTGAKAEYIHGIRFQARGALDNSIIRRCGSRRAYSDTSLQQNGDVKRARPKVRTDDRLWFAVFNDLKRLRWQSFDRLPSAEHRDVEDHRIGRRRELALLPGRHGYDQ